LITVIQLYFNKETTMAMNIGPGPSEDAVMSEMNTTPLIDVMLVLLVMLIITIPIQLHSVDLNMPIGNPPQPITKPEVVQIDIDADNAIRWNGEVLGGQTALEAKLSAAAAQAVQPELHLRPDKQAAYKTVAGVMAALQRKGLTKIGIVGGEQFN
jgi:biopolymer transport protein ExbD